MGNPTGNSLPKCQLARIQQMIDELDFPDRGSDKHISFWIDTLCIPINNPHERKLCIAKMANIYAQATAVLVLDSGLKLSRHRLWRSVVYGSCNVPGNVDCGPSRRAS
jgi:hypothetical protein